MRLFFVWPAPGPETKKLMDKLQKAGHQIPYWVCDPEDIGSRSDMILHNHFDAWSAIPAEGVPSGEFPPPGRDFIERLYRTESLVMTMMNKGFDGMPIDKRKSMYYEMVRYWNGVLDLYKPEAIVMPAVPHSSYVFILYTLARMRGLKTVMFENPWVSDRMLVYNDYEAGSPDLHEALKRNKGKLFTPDDLSGDLKEYYFWQTNKKADHTPIYMQFQNRMRTLSRFFPIKGLWTSIKYRSFWWTATHSLKKRFGPNLKREYRKFAIAPDWSKKFVYFPLSVQPERTSSPQSDVFVNQILTAKILSNALPFGWEIYVKEHPSQWVLRTGVAYNNARYRGYYEEFSKIDKVRLVPIDTGSHELMEKAEAVALIAGTAGWEAAMRGKTVLNFGLPWYRDFEGAIRVRDVESAKAAFDKINKGFKVDKDMVLNYLKCLDEGSSHAYLENMLDKISKLTKDENVDGLFKMVQHSLTF
ncbi:MAG TPA: hypothetical protein VJI33_01940 [Candidatus Paceibacterota bacterium]